jgi:hypothetical protein
MVSKPPNRTPANQVNPDRKRSAAARNARKNRRRGVFVGWIVPSDPRAFTDAKKP